MRIACFAVTVLFSMLTAPQAFACKPFGPGFDQPAPVVFWPEPPQASELQPGEVALKVTFSRFETDQDSREIDFSQLQPLGEDVVIITCFANPVFRIVEVLAGSAPDTSTVTLYGYGSNYRMATPEQILVGRLLPLKKTTRNGSAPAADSPSAMLVARLPAQ